MPDNDKLADDFQCLFTVKEGKVYVVELARRKPTRVKCERGRRYKLTKGTMFDLGNNEINLVE